MASILLAEDDTAMCRFLHKALIRAGHDVTSFTDGANAMQALNEGAQKGKSYDLLLADIVMPGMDGIELAQKATSRAPDLKVMFITGFAAVAMGHHNNNMPESTKVLSKPFHLKDLVNQVDQLLAA